MKQKETNNKSKVGMTDQAGANPVTRQVAKGKAAPLCWQSVCTSYGVREETGGEALKRLTWSD